MTTLTVDVDIVSVIDAAVPSLTTGVNLFAGPERAAGDGMPDKAVFVLADSGAAARPIKDARTERRPSLHIIVRSDTEATELAFSSGQQLAHDVHDAVDQNPPPGYCEARTVGSGPAYDGVDDDGHHVWSIYVDLIVDYTP